MANLCIHGGVNGQHLHMAVNEQQPTKTPMAVNEEKHGWLSISTTGENE